MGCGPEARRRGSAVADNGEEREERAGRWECDRGHEMRCADVLLGDSDILMDGLRGILVGPLDSTWSDATSRSFCNVFSTPFCVFRRSFPFISLVDVLLELEKRLDSTLYLSMLCITLDSIRYLVLRYLSTD